MRRESGMLTLLCLLALIAPLPLPAQELSEGPASMLRDGWQLQSACKLQSDGGDISSIRFHPSGWLTTSVPATVVAAQVKDGVLPQPYYGANLRELPGATYPVGANFSNLPMPADSPYRCGWWYRKEFNIPAADRNKTLWLHFGGINYRADIWLNGKKIADKADVAGAYRTYDFDITAQAATGKNILAVETFAPTEKDLGINWVDWNPCPPDKDMGLWGGVSLVHSGPVTLRSPMATTHFTDAALREADLTIYAELHNATDKPVRGRVTGTVAGVRIEQTVNLEPHQDQTVTFSPETFHQLRVHNPEIWWPYQMGSPKLQTLTLSFVTEGGVSDEKSVEFGIREVTSELTDKGYRLFRVNGKAILIRGGGWSQDMLLRQDPERLRDEFRLLRDMRLNAIRLEGKMETEDFFHLADEQGVLVMLGWCCCDQWEHWKKWTPENYAVAAESLRSQMLRVRHHASLLVWLNGSDNPPPADVESAYLKIEAETHWPNPTLSSASGRPTSVSGKSGVKMTGPYDYVAPSYWYLDDKNGGAFGFNTETSPGPAVPNLASLREFIPKDKLWPPDATWSLHNGGGEFKNLGVMNEAMDASFSVPKSVEDYIRLSQTMSYDSERAMFEAYGRNKYKSTGVIQWMLNNAWPSMIWHLYDYYLDADGGYFGAKKACEPLHIQYSYDDHSIFIVNSTYSPVSALHASVHVYDDHLNSLFSGDKMVDVSADGTARALEIPDPVFSNGAAGDTVRFVQLMLKDDHGDVVSRNFYWIPTSPTIFEWEKTDYTHTPALRHEDLKVLRSLPVATVQAKMRSVNSSEGGVEVTLHNSSHELAFQLCVAMRKEDGSLIAPTLWSDNYIELMPGESRTLTAILPRKDLTDFEVQLTGWNIQSQVLHAMGAEATADAREPELRSN